MTPNELAREIALQCPSCTSPRVKTRIVNDAFLWGVGDDPAFIECIVPVRHCCACGEEWLDHEGEKARDDAVERYKARYPQEPTHA